MKTPLKDALAEARRLLSTSAMPQQAGRDAELLLMHVLDCTRAFALSHPEAELTAEQVERYRTAVGRRALGEPVQYITGEQEFYGLRFAVSPDVLIPRPETEHLVEASLDRVDRTAALRIADVGTGSGAIAVALAKYLPLAAMTALDISGAALDVARRNATAHGVAERIRFIASDLLHAVGNEHFDAVVSNPPYISTQDRDTLAIEVRDYEPGVALFAGLTGLEIYARLIPEAYRCLKQGGLLLMEIGYGQRAALEELLGAWSDVEFIADLQGITRVVCARRS